MFWKVAGFSQPSPIEQILDKEEYTLEELLDEDDLIQECKSLNARLVAFLRERSTVKQLLRYLVEPASNSDDPKRMYKYPFTACELFCCEVEAVFNTLLEDKELMTLLFSLLDVLPPLDCKTAGYFGRVVGHLLLKKTNELMQHLQSQPDILEKLIQHVDTTSIADIVKRLVGADEQSSTLFIPAYAQWLSETPLVDLLLERLASGYSPEVQANAADVLSAIAHTQPSPLATKLTNEECIRALFNHALTPGQQVLVPALDVCIALVEPKRSGGGGDASGGSLDAAMSGGLGLGASLGITSGGGSSLGNSLSSSSSSLASNEANLTAARNAIAGAVSAIVGHLPGLVQLLAAPAGVESAAPPPVVPLAPSTPAISIPGAAGASEDSSGSGDTTADAAATADASGSDGGASAASCSSSGAVRQETPYGLLAPPLGRRRLKVVELLAVLWRSAHPAAHQALVHTQSLSICLALFRQFPFNNLLHHYVTAMIMAAIHQPSAILLQHLIVDVKLLDWLISLPASIIPTPVPGLEERAAGKAPLRAGYLGHVTQIASTLETMPRSAESTSTTSPTAAGSSPTAALAEGADGSDAAATSSASEVVELSAYLAGHAGWQTWLLEVLYPRLEVENTSNWACGRPVATDLGNLDSDGDDYQNDMDLEQIQGLQPSLYHRYNVVDEADEEEEEEDAGDLRATAFSTHMITEAISGMDINDTADAHQGQEGDEDADVSGRGSPGGSAGEGAAGSASGGGGEQHMEDDEVLLATSDDDEVLSDGGQPSAADVVGTRTEAEIGSPFSIEVESAGGPEGGGAATGDAEDMAIVEEEERDGSSPAVGVSIPTAAGGAQQQQGSPSSSSAAEGTGAYNDLQFWKPTWHLNTTDGA